MPQVKQKYQIKIPTNIKEAIDIHEGDIFEARKERGKLVLVPQLTHGTTPTKKQKPRNQRIDISQYMGSMKGVYGSTTEEMDTYIRKEREMWN